MKFDWAWLVAGLIEEFGDKVKGKRKVNAGGVASSMASQRSVQVDQQSDIHIYSWLN